MTKHIGLRHAEGSGQRRLTSREWATYHIFERAATLAEPEPTNHILKACRLFEEFCVDAFSQVECSRLNYLRYNQEKLRVECYKGLQDALNEGMCNCLAPLTSISHVCLMIKSK